MLEVLNVNRRRRPQMGAYAGQQYIGIDLHRRRSVIVRTTNTGEMLDAVQITNSPLALAEVMTRAGEHPEVVLESTYGWYWAVDVLQAVPCEPGLHLAHPLGVKAFEYRRVKNDLRDAATLPTCCGWAGCRNRGSPHRRSGNYASPSGTGPSWSPCARTARPRFTPCWPSAASPWR